MQPACLSTELKLRHLPHVSLQNWNSDSRSIQHREIHSCREGSWDPNTEGPCDLSAYLHRPSTGSHRFWVHLKKEFQVERHETKCTYRKLTGQLTGSTGQYWWAWRIPESPQIVMPISRSHPKPTRNLWPLQSLSLFWRCSLSFGRKDYGINVPFRAQNYTDISFNIKILMGQTPFQILISGRLLWQNSWNLEAQENICGP